MLADSAERENPVVKRTKARINREKKRKCGRKVKHSTFEQADNAAKILMMRDGRHSSAYLCNYCHYWHVGHTPFEAMMEMLYGDNAAD